MFASERRFSCDSSAEMGTPAYSSLDRGYSTSLDVTNLRDVLTSLHSPIPPRYLLASSRNQEYLAVNPSSKYPTPNQNVVPESQQFNKLTFLSILLKSLLLAMAEWPLFCSDIAPELPVNAKPMLTIRPGTDSA
jgi:2-oxoisovalerate dehydrogenase E2 component (dihydrolipoyl transacylase)